MHLSNSRLPSTPAGDYPAGRIRRYNLKMSTQYPRDPGAPPYSDQSAAIAAPPALTSGPSNQMGAGPLSAAATSIQTVASSAVFSAGPPLVPGDPAFFGRHVPGALPHPLTPSAKNLKPVKVTSALKAQVATPQPTELSSLFLLDVLFLLELYSLEPRSSI